MKSRRRIPAILFLAALFALVPQTVAAQGVEQVKAQYTKYEYRIPIRDGKRLFTAVSAPNTQASRSPILLTPSPSSVGPYGADQYKADLGPSPLFAKEGYIFAYQDVRGCWMSEGEFVNMRPQIASKQGPMDVDESSDTYDTIDWLVKNVANNKRRVSLA